MASAFQQAARKVFQPDHGYTKCFQVSAVRLKSALVISSEIVLRMIPVPYGPRARTCHTSAPNIQDKAL
jgi:hypothetical protein